MLHPFIDRITDHMGDGQVFDALPVELFPHPDATRKYLAFVNHELNNNLGGVLLSLHVLRQHAAVGNLDCAAARDMLDTATQVIKDTVAAARRFLHVERARHGGPPEITPIRLLDLARRMTLQFAAEAYLKGITLTSSVSADAVVVGNRELILLVLQNLVGNAVKYSASGTVCLGADVDEPTGAVEALWVSDEGCGIDREQLAHIFSAFGRGESHGATGVGLGLIVAAEASRLLGARLTVESHPGRGTTFYLAFPQDRCGAGTAPT